MKKNVPPCQPLPVPSWSISVIIHLHPRNWGVGYGVTKGKVSKLYTVIFCLFVIQIIKNAHLVASDFSKLVKEKQAVQQEVNNIIERINNNEALDKLAEDLKTVPESPICCNESCRSSYINCPVDCCLFCEDYECSGRCFYAKK